MMQRQNTGDEQDYHWAREFEFGDFHASTHHFVEKTLARAPKEIGCAFAASFLVSPLVSVIDKCIVKDISNTGKFMASMGVATREMIFTPKTFFCGLPFILTFAVYFGTYCIANLSELILDANKIKSDQERKPIKVAFVSLANVSLLAWRDSVFAREFGVGAPKATPIRTLGLFAARDSATMYATFYLAPAGANYLHSEHEWDRNTAELSMALGIPMLSQFVTAPFHIHAMDYYNNPAKVSLAARLGTITREFSTVAMARGTRILPAFGIGSFSNNKFREFFIRQEDENKLLTRRLTTFLERANTRTNNKPRLRRLGSVSARSPVVDSPYYRQPHE